MKVIDVSEWQGEIDFKKVKADGYEGVIIKAGYGKGNADKYFVRNINGAIKAKMHVGIYWFSYAYTEEMARNEAKYCADLIQTYKLNIDMPVFFDFEYDSIRWITEYGHLPYKKDDYDSWRPLITAMTKAFCEEIASLGYMAGYYVNHDFYNNYYSPSKLKKYKLWFADYEDEYKGCYLQQTSSEGVVDGITGKVDTDVLRGKIKAFNTEGDKSSSKSKKPVNEAQNTFKSPYEIGKTYTIDVNSALNVRKGAGKQYDLVGYSGLTEDGKNHAYSTGALKNGTRVTVQDVKVINDKNVWVKIPSGWICAIDGDRKYVI